METSVVAMILGFGLFCFSMGWYLATKAKSTSETEMPYEAPGQRPKPNLNPQKPIKTR